MNRRTGDNFSPSVHASESSEEDGLVMGGVLAYWLLLFLQYLMLAIPVSLRPLLRHGRSANFLASTPAVLSAVPVSPTCAQTACAVTGPGATSDVQSPGRATAAVHLSLAADLV